MKRKLNLNMPLWQLNELLPAKHVIHEFKEDDYRPHYYALCRMKSHNVVELYRMFHFADDLRNACYDLLSGVSLDQIVETIYE